MGGGCEGEGECECEGEGECECECEVEWGFHGGFPLVGWREAMIDRVEWGIQVVGIRVELREWGEGWISLEVSRV